MEPLNKRGNKHKSESEESLRPIQCVTVSLPVSPNRSVSLSFSRSSICMLRVYVCWCRQGQFKEFVWPQANLQHPPAPVHAPFSSPPPPSLYTHTLSRAADHGIVIKLYTILGAHQHRHRPNTPAGQSSGLFVPVRVSLPVCPFVSLSALVASPRSVDTLSISLR